MATLWKVIETKCVSYYLEYDVMLKKCFGCYRVTTENAEKWQNCNLRPCHNCSSSWLNNKYTTALLVNKPRSTYTVFIIGKNIILSFKSSKGQIQPLSKVSPFLCLLLWLSVHLNEICILFVYMYMMFVSAKNSYNE